MAKNWWSLVASFPFFIESVLGNPSGPFGHRRQSQPSSWGTPCSTPRGRTGTCHRKYIFQGCQCATSCTFWSCSSCGGGSVWRPAPRSHERRRTLPRTRSSPSSWSSCTAPSCSWCESFQYTWSFLTSMWSSSISSVSVAAPLLFCPWLGLATNGTSRQSWHSAKAGQGRFVDPLASGTSSGPAPWRRRCSNAVVGTSPSSGWCPRLALPVSGLLVTMVGISWEDSGGVWNASPGDPSRGWLGSSGISGRLSGPGATPAWKAGASCSSWPLANAACRFPYQSCQFEFTCPAGSQFHFFLFLIMFCLFSCRNLCS